jgi:hypothetical protein
VLFLLAQDVLTQLFLDRLDLLLILRVFQREGLLLDHYFLSHLLELGDQTNVFIFEGFVLLNCALLLFYVLLERVYCFLFQI